MLPPRRLLEQNGVHATGDSAAPTMKRPPENQSQEVLAGLVERVTYYRRTPQASTRAKARNTQPW
jgi:hypothetical protein